MLGSQGPACACCLWHGHVFLGPEKDAAGTVRQHSSLWLLHNCLPPLCKVEDARAVNDAVQLIKSTMFPTAKLVKSGECSVSIQGTANLTSHVDTSFVHIAF